MKIIFYFFMFRDVPCSGFYRRSFSVAMEWSEIYEREMHQNHQNKFTYLALFGSFPNLFRFSIKISLRGVELSVPKIKQVYPFSF